MQFPTFLVAHVRNIACFSVRVSWGTATVGAAAASVAAAEILAPFVASLPGQDMVRSEAGRAALGGTTVLEEPAIAR